MAVFNFDIKKQSYRIALEKSKELFTGGDMESGTYYLNMAIDLSRELIAHCIIEELRNNYVIENRKLVAIKTNYVDKGINPFLPRQTVTANNGAGNRPHANSPSSQETSDEPKEVFFKKESPKTTLADVAGLADVKEEIMLNVISPLRNPELYHKYKDKAGCNILMYGPPGCGKSFVAEAIAGELKCAYAVVYVSDILDKYVGEAPRKIAEIFKEAEQYDKCLIFFDELDSLFASRESDDSSHTKDVLTAFLTCLSGFGTNDNNQVRVVIGATNRPWALDSALLRGGRLDTHIYVTLPDRDARLFMVKRAFKNRDEILENTDITVDEITDMLDGYSGADITSITKKIITRAYSRAVRNDAQGINKVEPITRQDAIDVIGSYRNSITNDMMEAFEAFKNGEI